MCRKPTCKKVGTIAEVVSVLNPIQGTLDREINPIVYPPKEFREKLFADHHFLMSVLDEEKIFLIGDAKVIVSWGWQQAAEDEADRLNIVLWDVKDLLKDIASAFKSDKIYFTDDTLRTLQLYSKAID